MNRRPFASIDFAYWLQGAIEIAGLKGFTPEQIRKIKKRLDDVEVRDEFIEICWLIMHLFGPTEAFSRMSQTLQDVFIHDIDPTYDGDQTHFKKIHDGIAP